MRESLFCLFKSCFCIVVFAFSLYLFKLIELELFTELGKFALDGADSVIDFLTLVFGIRKLCL